MFVATIRTEGLTLLGDACLMMGKYETFEEARRAVENDVSASLSFSSRYAVLKSVDRSDSGDRVTIHWRMGVGDEYDFDVDDVFEIFQEGSANS